MAESWQKAEVPGPIKALLLNNPKVVAEYLKKANRSVIIIGDKILEIEKEGYKILDLIKKLSNKINAEIVTSSPKIIEEMREKNINARIMPSIEF
ncbi:MAG: carbon monoxide dehydrogenase beta subunit family protein, partial [Candidatus Aenigmatarchaeota archaeon]